MKKPDYVRCHFCGVTVFTWEPNDTAGGEHEEYSPNCIFYLGNETQNIPLNTNTNVENSETHSK